MNAGLQSAQRRSGRLFVLLVLLAAAGALAWFLLPDDDESPSYQTTRVTRTDVLEVVSGSGRVEPARTTDIRAGQPGVLTEVGVREGQALEAGQELFRVNGHPVFALPGDYPFYRVLSPGAEGEDVRALQRLLSDLGYYQGQVDGEYGPGTREAMRDFLEDRGVERTDRVGPETFQSAGSAAVVGAVALQAGALVRPESLVLRAVPSGELDGLVQINEVDISRVQLGQRALVSLDALPGREIEAEVTGLPFGLLESPQQGGSAGVTTFPVRLRLESPGQEVKAGMSLEADLILETAQAVLALPVGALQEREGQDLVLVPGPEQDGRPGQPLPVPVEIGLRSDDLVEVRAGLEDGQSVIVGLDVNELELPAGGLFSPPSPRSTGTTEER